MKDYFAVITAAVSVGDDTASQIAEALRKSGAATRMPNRLGVKAIEIGYRADASVLLPFLPDHDLNIVPAKGREKKLLVADMDSTIIGVECIDEIADYAGVKAEVAAITERAMRGELDFEGALNARLSLLAGLDEAVLADCYAERVKLNPGAETLVRTMRQRCAMTALVSGGFAYFSSRVAEAAGFEFNHANELEIESGRLTGRVIPPIVGRQAKLQALETLSAQRGIGTDAAVAIGDGANDLSMIRAAGLGVAYRAKPAVAAEADVSLDHSDLTAVLALQGIAERDYVYSTTSS